MHSLISWFARNGVVANILMFTVVAGGIVSIPEIKKEVFPEISLDMVQVQVSYRGAAPEEVEEGVCVRIEEAVQDIEGIDKITSTASEGSGMVNIEIEVGYDTRDLLDDIKTRIDAIDTFPEEAEKPVIQQLTNRMQVINLSISGQTDMMTLKRVGERVRDELLNHPEITQAELKSAPLYEISIEVSEDDLRRHNLTFDFVANAVRRASVDLPGGSIKSASGEILLRTKGQAYVGKEFEQLTLLSRPDGTRLALSDVAHVVDGFEESDLFARMDGEPAVLVQVFRVGDQSALEIAELVNGYVVETQALLPEGIRLTAWGDSARILRGRMDLLLKNALSGLLLVFTVLALFLRLRLAFWVTLGIPISFLGAIAMMPILDVSISMISLFSFILVLGIVVDDAIVVGEAIFARQEETGEGLNAAIEGTNSVAVPVIFGVLTTAVAFAPMLFVDGFMGKIWQVIPCIIIPTLLFSLVESKLVLPYHLSHYKPPRQDDHPPFYKRIWEGFFGFFGNGLAGFIQRIYRPVLGFALEWRYLTLAICLATLMLTMGLVSGGYVKIIFFPDVESDNVAVDLTLPQETPAEVTSVAIAQLEAAAQELGRQLEEEEGRPIFMRMMTSVGEQPFKAQGATFAGGGPGAGGQPNLGEVNIELAPTEERTITANAIAQRWRALAPPIPDIVELTFNSSMLESGKAIDIEFSGDSIEELQVVAAKTKQRLREYPGVIDITDSFRGGKPEIKLDVTSRAESLGLSRLDLGRQVRQGFFGEEAQRIQRGRDDVRVMIRYPESERKSLGDLEQMRIRTPTGDEVPFSAVASASMGRGFATIKRVDRRRTINVTAEVDETITDENKVLADIQAGFLPALLTEHRGVRYSLEGASANQAEAMEALAKGFVVALFVIYVLMAIPFGSYVQPLIVMSAVPFGVVGAIWGHMFMGMSMSMLSMCGVVALSGVVVNDSLVLVSFINKRRAAGDVPLRQAVIEAGVSRFRPILLTSLTTAAGVTPLMLEQSMQAKFLIPMAVALAYGVLFATVITLALVPAIYLILEDFRSFFRWLWFTPQVAEEPTVSETTDEPEPQLRAARSPVDQPQRWPDTERIGAD